MASLYISAAHKSSGKTTLSIGVNAALVKRGLNIQPFKKGPDYIDPIWLGMAAGKPCYSLDFFTAGIQETIEDFWQRSHSADIAIIEGNKGLYDGLDLDGSNSNAALAKALDTPVILVIDARGTMRGIAPLLIGYQVFDPDVRIAGVIANMTGGERHESKLRAAVEHYTDIPFLGALDNNPMLSLEEQHLGLIPGYEAPAAKRKIAQIAEAVNNQVDLDKMIELAQLAPNPATMGWPTTTLTSRCDLSIGVARDAAFGFYYPGDLEAMRASGANIVFIDTLKDSFLPAIDGLFIGGGFPERHAEGLQANSRLRASIKSAIEEGLPTYAECGGLMYLSRQLEYQGRRYDMVGVIKGDTTMHAKPCGRGYVKLEEQTQNALWPPAYGASPVIHAHEFHYSSVAALPPDSRYTYTMQRGQGIGQGQDGLIYKNLMASYSHLRHTRQNPWVNRFLGFVQACTDRRMAPPSLRAQSL